MSGSVDSSGSRSVLQSFSLTEEQDAEIRMIAARYKSGKGKLLQGLVAASLRDIKAGNQKGDGVVREHALELILARREEL